MQCVLIALLAIITAVNLTAKGDATLTVPLLKDKPESIPDNFDSISLEERHPNEDILDGDARFKRGYFYPGSGKAPKTWGGKMLKKFRKRTSNIIGSDHYPFSDNHHNDYDQDEVEDSDMAGTFWNLYGGGGGGGHGGGYGSGYGKGVNKSAVGLLGFLSLLSLIQSGLTTTAAAAAPAPAPAPAPIPPRRKREADNIQKTSDHTVIETTQTPTAEDEQNHLMRLVLPVLAGVTVAQSEIAAMDCTLHEICHTNSMLVNVLGDKQGRSVGIMVSDALCKMLKDKGKAEIIEKFRYAAKAGRNRKNCDELYNRC